MTRLQSAATAALSEAAVCAAFSWALVRYTETGYVHLLAPLLVYGTCWLLCTVFCTAYVWESGTQAARPPKQPGPTRPPEQPKPEETPRPAPGPIQPRPPKPPRQTETTLVDMAPVEDLIQEIPRVGHAARVPRHVPPEQLLSGDWRPRVAPDAKEGER